MDSRNALDSIHRDEFLMELTQGTSTQQQSQQGMTAVADMSSQKANFSYPRPDSRVIRHEPTDSRSSMTSNGSVPGMTDASDSEASADDDFHYNASASELWDSFWPNDTSRPQNVQQVQGSASPSIETSEYFTTTASPLKSERLDDGTLTIPSAEHQPEQLRSFQWPLPNPRNARPRPVQPRAPATFSICPKAVDEESTSSQTPIPARSTSLTPEAAPRPQHTIKRKPLRSSKSIANLAMSLRPSASAFDMRRQHAEDLEKRTYHNATAPLAPLPAQPFLEQSAMAQRPARPQLERNVSVFECDSDDESDYEAESKFVRRLTRGLQHKKSTIGGDRGSSKTHGSSTLSPPHATRWPRIQRWIRDPETRRVSGPNPGTEGSLLVLKSYVTIHCLVWISPHPSFPFLFQKPVLRWT
ncbi:hypothetical protein PG988_006944 [Apiospora saccharicola]